MRLLQSKVNTKTMIQCTFSSVCILMRMTLWVKHLRAAMLIQPPPLWLYLYMDARSFGNVAAWIHGNTDALIHELHGCTDARILGCMDAWMHGYMYDVWCMMYDVWCTMYVWCRVQGWSSLPRIYIYIYNLQHVFGRMHGYMDDVRCMMWHVLSLVQIAFFNCRQSVQKHTAQESTEDVKKVKKKSYWDFWIQWFVS